MKTLVYFSLLLVISFIVISCKKESPFLLRSGKSINSIDYIQNQFLIFKDSTFSFTSTIQDRIRDYYKNETFKGKLKIKKDTLFTINDGNFRFVEANKAVLKNGFIDFYDQFNQLKLRLEIIESDLEQVKNIDFNNYPDYAVFNRNSSTDSIKYYDLKINELIKVDSIINNSINQNQETSLKKNDYIKQLTVFKNIDDDVIVECDLYCNEDEHTKQYFRYNYIHMFDGGICNGGLVINLTKNSVSELSFAGDP